MSDEIVFEGNTYVSSKRASEMSSYAQDYIGQLARKGFIEARRVGGLWYVVMSSLESYKSAAISGETKEVKQVNVKVKESETSVEFEGNTYISASRVSDITGYNQDYVGQLARSGKIPSHQVGNRWYIDLEAISRHKKEKDELLAKVQSESLGISTVGITQRTEIHSTKNLNDPNLLTYKSTEGDLIPRIKEREYRDLKIERGQQPTIHAGPPRIREIEVRHVNRTKDSNQYSKIGQARYVNKAKNKNKSIKYAFLSIVAALVLISILVTLFKFGSTALLLNQIENSTTSGASPINNGVFSRILGGVEQLISPQLLYVRK